MRQRLRTAARRALGALATITVEPTPEPDAQVTSKTVLANLNSQASAVSQALGIKFTRAPDGATLRSWLADVKKVGEELSKLREQTRCSVCGKYDARQVLCEKHQAQVEGAPGGAQERRVVEVLRKDHDRAIEKLRYIRQTCGKTGLKTTGDGGLPDARQQVLTVVDWALALEKRCTAAEHDLKASKEAATLALAPLETVPGGFVTRWYVDRLANVLGACHASSQRNRMVSMQVRETAEDALTSIDSRDHDTLEGLDTPAIVAELVDVAWRLDRENDAAQAGLATLRKAHEALRESVAAVLERMDAWVPFAERLPMGVVEIQCSMIYEACTDLRSAIYGSAGDV